MKTMFCVPGEKSKFYQLVLSKMHPVLGELALG